MKITFKKPEEILDFVNKVKIRLCNGYEQRYLCS